MLLYVIGFQKVLKTNKMNYIIIFAITLLVCSLIVWRWVVGLDYMIKNHPNYKGDDLFGEFDDDDKHQIGNGK